MTETTAGIALSEARGQSIWRTETLRRFVYATLLMVGLIGLFWIISLVEPGTAEARIVEKSPTESALRFAFIAHFIIGTWFLLASDKTRNRRSRISFLVCCAMSVVLCLLFKAAGGVTSAVELHIVVFYAYFLMHECRDERYFYGIYGEAPPKRSPRPQDLNNLAFVVAFVAFMLAGLWSVPFLREGKGYYVAWLVDTNELGRAGFAAYWLLPIAGLIAAGIGVMRWAAKGSGMTPLQMLKNDRPLWAVYLGVFLITAIGWAADNRLYTSGLIHVCAWWVFATGRLSRFGKSGGPRELGLAKWFRQSQTGFQVLHVGLVLAALGLAVFWIYGLGKPESNPLAWVVGADAFYYMTLVHVTLSFTPKGG